MKNVNGSPFWSNLIGSDINKDDVFKTLPERYTTEEKQLWTTAYAFTQLLAKETLSHDDIKKLVFEKTMSDWGDFSKAVALYKAIPSPGISSAIQYNKQCDKAFIYVYPHVEESFSVDSPQIISDFYRLTLVKDSRLGEWKVFAFGGCV